LSDKDTEIAVLKEMIKSSKHLVKAKEVDVARLKQKVNVLEGVPI
jgi:hypothetical protein